MTHPIRAPQVSNLLSPLQMKTLRLWWWLLLRVQLARGLVSSDTGWKGAWQGRPGVLYPSPTHTHTQSPLSPRLRCRSKTSGSCLRWGIFKMSWRSCGPRAPTGRMPGPPERRPPSGFARAQKAGVASRSPWGGWLKSSEGKKAGEAPFLNIQGWQQP
jgi:hypothetical protein